MKTDCSFQPHSLFFIQFFIYVTALLLIQYRLCLLESYWGETCWLMINHFPHISLSECSQHSSFSEALICLSLLCQCFSSSHFQMPYIHRPYNDRHKSLELLGARRISLFVKLLTAVNAIKDIHCPSCRYLRLLTARYAYIGLLISIQTCHWIYLC